MAELIITERSNMVALANTVRNKTGQTKELALGEILDAFENTEVAKNQDITITENGTYTPASGFTGFGSVKVETEIAKNQDITITENGTYIPEDGFTGFGSVNVEVESSDGSYEDVNEKYY